MISCLSITCRPQFQPWLLHQFRKQTHLAHRLVVFDDSLSPQQWPSDVVVLRAKLGSLGEKRQYLLDCIEGAFAWFDDDDWHPVSRLTVGAAMLERVDVVGCRDGLFTDVTTLRPRRLEIEPLVFHSAVFGAKSRLHKFQPLHRGEDTAWMQLVVRDAMLCTTPELRHAWLSHDTNVTGKRGSMSFEGPAFKRFDSWETGFLRALGR